MADLPPYAGRTGSGVRAMKQGRALIRRRHGIRLAARTTGTYLARWGSTTQKPLRRAWEAATGHSYGLDWFGTRRRPRPPACRPTILIRGRTPTFKPHVTHKAPMRSKQEP